jgi:geranylgeranyl pyrophosphate synthase
VTNSFSLKDWIKQHQAHIEAVLDQALSKQNQATSDQLLEAMRYSTLNGGKRLRALLVYATGQAFGVELKVLDAAAAAVEMIHAYSLVHDDMPIMDDDDLRRGKPTCHKQYDDATALLVGDALQTLAFETLANNPYVSAEQKIAMVAVLAKHSGAYGMAGGQAIDLESVGQQLNLTQLQQMHELKTGALIRASVRLGALASTNIEQTTLDKLDIYAHHIGLAFQVQDDVLDVVADTETLGKPQGSDLAADKPTYPALMGLEQAQQKAKDLIAEAQQQLDALDHDGTVLTALANYVVERTH